MKMFAVNIPVENELWFNEGISYIRNPRDLFERFEQWFLSLWLLQSLKEDKYLKPISCLMKSQWQWLWSKSTTIARHKCGMWIGVNLNQKSYFPGLDLYPEWSVIQRHFPHVITDTRVRQYLVKMSYLVKITFISIQATMAFIVFN